MIFIILFFTENVNYKPLYYIIYLHTYHFFIKKLSIIEFVHHILFVFLEALPCIFIWNSNTLSLIILSGCGIPGKIDYFILLLVKNNIISYGKQKKISAIINNYLRLSLGIYGLSLTYISYMENLIKYEKWFFIYVCVLVYINITFFNKLAIENNIKYKYKQIAKEEGII